MDFAVSITPEQQKVQMHQRVHLEGDLLTTICDSDITENHWAELDI